MFHHNVEAYCLKNFSGRKLHLVFTIEPFEMYHDIVNQNKIQSGSKISLYSMNDQISFINRIEYIKSSSPSCTEEFEKVVQESIMKFPGKIPGKVFNLKVIALRHHAISKKSKHIAKKCPSVIGSQRRANKKRSDSVKKVNKHQVLWKWITHINIILPVGEIEFRKCVKQAKKRYPGKYPKNDWKVKEISLLYAAKKREKRKMEI